MQSAVQTTGAGTTIAYRGANMSQRRRRFSLTQEDELDHTAQSIIDVVFEFRYGHF
jgi:hypothetical protein